MEAGPLGRLGYGLRSKENEGSRERENGEEADKEKRVMEVKEKSFIKPNAKCSLGNKAGRVR